MFGIGAYVAGLLIKRLDISYWLAAPSGVVAAMAVGTLLALPALRLSGIYLALATFALATAMPQILKFHALEGWTGGVQGIQVDPPGAPFGLPLNTVYSRLRVGREEFERGVRSLSAKEEQV